MDGYNTYKSPLTDRYAGAEMSYNWSPQRKHSTWRRLWLALAESEKQLGLNISQEQIDQMKAHLDDIDFEAVAKKEAELSGNKLETPKITLTGKISEDRESNSSAREVTYTFSLELNHRGSPVWIGEKQITKQSSKGMFGL